MENNIKMIENILNTERRNRRGNREIRFEVNSNYYKAVSKLLSDYKRVLKENEILKNKLLDTLKGQKAIEEETPQYVKENYISKENKRQLMRSALRKDRYYNKFIRE